MPVLQQQKLQVKSDQESLILLILLETRAFLLLLLHRLDYQIEHNDN
jgi:hypothetical protein